MSNQVNSFVKTRREVEELSEAISELRADVYKKVDLAKLRVSLEQRFPEIWVEELMGLMADEKKEEKLKELALELETLDIAKVKLAFEPTASFVEELVDGLRQKVGERYVVELEVDRDILGGTVLEIGGRFYDLSLKKLFEENMASFEKYLKDTGEVGYVDQVVHSILKVRGLPGVRASEVVIFENDGIGQVLSLGEGVAEVLPLSKQILKVDSRVARTGRLLETVVGEKLLGRTVDPLGSVLDGDGVVGTESLTRKEIDQDPVGIMDRETIVEPFEVGVALVDLVIPLARGQRELLVGDRKTGKSQFLMQTILTQARKGTICVYAAIGKRKTDIKKFEEFIKTNNLSENILIVASTSEDVAGMIYLTPYAAMTHAGYFKDLGRDVLIIMDDMTTHARFYREITLLAQRFPGRSSYPGDIFYTHARLIERAGKFKKGSITALPVAETVLGDMSGYIQTDLMSMTDGHLLFDSEFFNQGRRPAINPFLSVTRVGLQAQTPLVRDLSRQVNSFLVKQERLRQFMHFGAELSEEVKKDLDLGDRLINFFDQPSTKVIPISVSIIVVAALWAGWWRDITISEMKKELVGLAEEYKTTPEYTKKVDDLIAQSKTFTDLVSLIKDNPGLISRAVSV